MSIHGWITETTQQGHMRLNQTLSYMCRSPEMFLTLPCLIRSIGVNNLRLSKTYTRTEELCLLCFLHANFNRTYSHKWEHVWSRLLPGVQGGHSPGFMCKLDGGVSHTWINQSPRSWDFVLQRSSQWVILIIWETRWLSDESIKYSGVLFFFHRRCLLIFFLSVYFLFFHKSIFSLFFKVPENLQLNIFGFLRLCWSYWSRGYDVHQITN